MDGHDRFGIDSRMPTRKAAGFAPMTERLAS
jgi:hypothetical protein